MKDYRRLTEDEILQDVYKRQIRGCQVYKLAFNPFLLKKARASLRPMTRSF